jgi:hypothetical protein
MTGVETLVLIFKIASIALTTIGGFIAKFLWDIKATSKKTEQDFHSFKTDFNTEIANLKHKIDIIDSKTKDSYSKSDSDLRLLTLENKLTKEMTDGFNKLRDLIFSSLNRSRQISKSEKTV